MKREQEMVKEFMLKAGQICPDKPILPAVKLLKLRDRLIHEEYCELYDCSKEGYQDITKICDAIADLLYVVIGTAVAYGIDIEPIFNEVHRSNMSKFIDGYKREDGKWIKGPSYSPANLEPLIQMQMK